MRRIQTSEFPVLSIIYRPTELGAGPQHSETRDSTLVRRDLCDMLRDSRLVGLDNLVTLSIAAVLSICEYTVSNKWGLLCHCLGDCGGYAPTPLPIVPPPPPPPPTRGFAAYVKIICVISDITIPFKASTFLSVCRLLINKSSENASYDCLRSFSFSFSDKLSHIADKKKSLLKHFFFCGRPLFVS